MVDLVIYRMVHTTQNGIYYTNKLDVSFEEIEKEIHKDLTFVSVCLRRHASAGRTCCTASKQSGWPSLLQILESVLATFWR